jgi:hypothetical protein
MQRAGRVFEDEVVWVDVYPNPDNLTDLAVLEDLLYVVPDIGLADSRTDAQKALIASRVAASTIAKDKPLSEIAFAVNLECET